MAAKDVLPNEIVCNSRQAADQPRGCEGLQVYFGDLHNHCDLSYGRGSLSDALKNAHLQLDFVSVTVHAVWPDLPLHDPSLDYLIDYHRRGFVRARENWPTYLEAMEQANEDHRFVTLSSYEWHSMAYGDYCIYFKDCTNVPIADAVDLPTLRQVISQGPSPAFLIPHHIGYQRGMRGINWSAFSAELSPLAEIFSFHGLSESSEGPYPYLHAMGPRDGQSTAQYGWSQGHVFGVIGSSDHHNAFPGSYGCGRLGVWAESLTRDALWDAMAKRRTYALTGDRIELAFWVNGHLMGAVAPPAQERWIEVALCGGASIDYVEVLCNNRVVHRESVSPQGTDWDAFKVYLELGWGERSEDTTWDVDLQVIDGQLHQVEPRFRGYGPTDTPGDVDFAYTDWQQVSDNRVHFSTRTRQNRSLHTASTEGMALELQGDAGTRLRATINGRQRVLRIADLTTGSRTFYLGGFVSPAVCFHRAVPRSEYSHRFAFLHRSASSTSDWYYVRVRQRNDQWAWSSPIWVQGQPE